MKNTPWLKYLILILLIIGSLIVDKYFYYKVISNPFITPFCFIALPTATLLNIAIGVLIGFEYIRSEAKKDGHWRFNWLRALILLVPTLYLIIGFTGIIYGRIIFKPIMYLYKLKLLSSGMDVLSIMRLLFGYWFITSFYKKVEVKKQVTHNSDLSSQQAILNGENK